jgi:hypothetical protein
MSRWLRLTTTSASSTSYKIPGRVHLELVQQTLTSPPPARFRTLEPSSSLCLSSRGLRTPPRTYHLHSRAFSTLFCSTLLCSTLLCYTISPFQTLLQPPTRKSITMSPQLAPSNPDEVMVIRDLTPRITTLSLPFARGGKVKIGGRATISKSRGG